MTDKIQRSQFDTERISQPYNSYFKVVQIHLDANLTNDQIISQIDDLFKNQDKLELVNSVLVERACGTSRSDTDLLDVLEQWVIKYSEENEKSILNPKESN